MRTGRWGLFKKPLKDEEISFGDWLREKREIHAGHRNERLWSVTSELYTKTLAGVVVDKHLQLSFVHLETAKEWLAVHESIDAARRHGLHAITRRQHDCVAVWSLTDDFASTVASSPRSTRTH